MMDKVMQRTVLPSTVAAGEIMFKIQHLVNQLNASGIRYCHWKSNLSLAESLSGSSDIDLLVHRNDATQFRGVLSHLGFQPATPMDGESFPSVEHYYALDEANGALAHVHAYYRVITGESLAKNYHFPIEDLILQNTRREGSVPVPAKSVELIVFTLRIMLKHTSLMELFLMYRYWDTVREEIHWLMEGASQEKTIEYVSNWLPSIDTALFATCIAAIQQPAPLMHRIALARRLRSQIRTYARHSALYAWLVTVQRFAIMSSRRLTRTRKGMLLHSGGAVIAFVGPEATGKSTLLGETKRWLGEHFAVEQVHAGKPKPTLLGFIPNRLVPTLRLLLPKYRSSHIEALHDHQDGQQKAQSGFPLVFAIRAVLLAYDRRALLIHAHASAANGAIILCDRYPSMTRGAPDGPQLFHLLDEMDKNPLRRWLASTEQRLYQQIPTPDLVISLTVPVEVAVQRNKARGKTEPEDYLRRRHALASHFDYGKAYVVSVSTDQPLGKTVLDIKRAIWNTL